MATLGEMIVRINGDNSGLNRSLGAAESSIKKIGQSMTNIGTKMSAAITLPIVGLGVSIAKTAGDFQSGMAAVKAISSATGEEFKSLTEQAKFLGKTTQYTATQASEAMQFLAMAGFDAKQIFDAMPGTLQLAASAQMDLGNAADIVSNILTGYGMQVEELAHVNDVLVKAFTSSNVDLTMLGVSMKYVGPIASAMGFSFEEVAASVGMLGNAGIQGSMAGTALRGALSRLSSPTKEVSKLISKLGLNFYDSQGKIKSMVGIIKELESKSVSAADMLVLFGDRAGPGIAAMVEQGSGALDELTKKLQDSGGVAKEVADARMAGLNGAIKRLTSAWEGLQIAIADSGFLDALTGVVDRITNVLSNLSETNPELLRMGTIIAIVAAMVGPLLVVLGMLATAIAAISWPVVAIVAAIGLFVAALIYLWNTNEQVRLVITEGFASMYESIISIIDNLVAAFEFAWPIMSSIVENVVITITSLLSGLLQLLGGVIEFLVGVFTLDFEKAWYGIQNIVVGVVKIIISAVQSLVNNILTGINALTYGINQVTSKLGMAANIPKIEKLNLLSGFAPYEKKATASTAKKSGVGSVIDSLFKSSSSSKAPTMPGGKSKVKVKSPISDSIGNAATNLDDLGKATKKKTDAQKKAEKDVEDAMKRQENYMEDFIKKVYDASKAIMDFGGMFEKVVAKKFSGEKFIKAMKGQLDILKDWRKNITELGQKLGTKSSLYNALLQAGPGSAGEIKALNELSSSKLSEYSSLYGEKEALAMDMGVKQTYSQGYQDTAKNNIVVNITGNTIKEDYDIDRIAELMTKKLKAAGVY